MIAETARMKVVSTCVFFVNCDLVARWNQLGIVLEHSCHEHLRKSFLVSIVLNVSLSFGGSF